MSSLAEAYAAHAAGRLADAERGYRAMLKGEPRNADAWHLLGVLAQQQGKSQEAAEMIGRAVEIAGPQPVYLSNLGVALQAAGRNAEALQALEQSAARDPTFNTLFALGNTLRALQRLPEAEARYRAALALQPQNASAYNNLGNTLQDLGRMGEAEEAYRRTITLNPSHVRAHYNLGLILKDSARTGEAETHLRQAAALDPELLEAHIHLGALAGDAQALENVVKRARLRLASDAKDTSARGMLNLALSELGMHHKRRGDLPRAVALMDEALSLRGGDVVLLNNLANTLLSLDRPTEAEAHLRTALAAAPAMPETHFHLGNALKAQDRFTEAVAAYEAALDLRPAFYKARINHGSVLKQLGDYARARASYEAGIAADPTVAELWNVRGILLQTTEHHDEALASFERARELKPNLAEAHRNAGLALLMQGDYARGWEAYDWRWKCEGAATTARDIPMPPWQGERGPGGVVLWGEQGLGDKVLYAGMIPELLAQGHKVVFETDPRLFALFQRSFPGLTAVPRDHPAISAPDMRWQVPLAGLGRWLRASAEAFPARASYLVSDPARRAALRAQLESLGGKGPIVGISWASTNPKIGRHKTLALKHWAPILKQAGIRFVDLQYGDTAAERADVEAELGVKITHIEGLDLREDIEGVTALAAACDLVIGVSSTTVHFAAAVGVPTWVLVPASAGNLWYWGLKGERTPWYPNVRVIRQNKLGEWVTALAETARRLADFQA